MTKCNCGGDIEKCDYDLASDICWEAERANRVLGEMLWKILTEGKRVEETEVPVEGGTVTIATVGLSPHDEGVLDHEAPDPVDHDEQVPGVREGMEDEQRVPEVRQRREE